MEYHRTLQVALLFLVLDDIPHEALWRKWLDGIGGKLPARLLCNGEAMACFKALPPGGTDPVYDAQHFYTLYVHTKPEFPGYPEGHLFHNRIIRERVPVSKMDLVINLFSDFKQMWLSETMHACCAACRRRGGTTRCRRR